MSNGWMATDCDYCARDAKYFLCEWSGKWYWSEHKEHRAESQLQTCGIHKRSADKDLGAK